MSTRESRAFEFIFSNEPVPEEMKQYRIGDDLSPEMLDELHRYWDDGCYNSMAYWWEDKAHQIGRRLLMRLTRAECKIQELEAELEKLKKN